ncbi:hypothetical protein [Mycoplasma suis]|uniref:hypothetical protein n=1 Tax=Mycoplasma suis TaxID=57372 RepID=UPI0002F83615|nr:hypothetical protein [Mycoplasma suis]
MKKLSINEKKIIRGGAASLMGIATGILTFSSLANLIMDLINRYWKRKPTIVETSVHENCFNNPECYLPKMGFQRNPEDLQENRITFL